MYNKALNRYCVQHNCSVDIMLEEKSELDRLNELLDELKKKEQVDYFVEWIKSSCKFVQELFIILFFGLFLKQCK